MTGAAGTEPAQDRVSTGLPGLDQVLDGLRIGDNVVWRVSDLDDYRRFVAPFVAAAATTGRRIIYLRFGQHPPLVSGTDNIRVVSLDALGGFEAFTSQVWRLIEEHGRGAFYICDCLSDLLDAWATDTMVGNFFRVVCPFLFELDTVAWFALYPSRHSRTTLDRIRETTQVLVDIHRAGDDVQVQPIKVWRRQSPTMFLPHREEAGRFVPVTDSSDATRLQAAIEQQQVHSQPLLDYWDRLFMELAQTPDEPADAGGLTDICDRVLQVLVSRDPRMLALARQHLRRDELLTIRSRLVGSGYIGGKAAGMLIARSILLNCDPSLWQQCLEPHDSSYLGSDVYYAFLVHNGLWPAIMRQRCAEGYLTEAPALRAGILAGEFPAEYRAELERLLDHYGQYPILVRSSSLQEDGFGNAFAGKYDSVFLVNQGPPEQRLGALEDAIRQVYASTMSEDALVYRKQRGLDQREEPMALLLQRVNGRFHGQYYLPDAAGVGVSRNTFVWDRDMDPAAGMVRLVMGLGTRAVDRIEGDHACVMALDHPSRRPFRNEDESFRFSQHLVDVLDTAGAGLITLPLSRLGEAAADLPLDRLGEQDRAASSRARELGLPAPVWRLTFQPLIRQGAFVSRVRSLLATLEAAYQHPVDVEFTVHLSDSQGPTFNLVQCRPLATLGESAAAVMPDPLPASQLLFANQGHFMGGNINLQIDRIIRVNAEHYAQLTQPARYQVASLVGELVRQAPAGQRIMLIGPGRWGTSSPELGVPVRFADIAGIAALVEVAERSGEMVPDLSYGSHFFQDLVETGIAYVALFPQDRHCEYYPERLLQFASDIRQLPEHSDLLAPGVVEVYELESQPLSLSADVVSQQLACFVPPPATPD